MLLKKEPTLNFVISPMDFDDIELATKMRFEVWLDTYVNNDNGVTINWLKSHIAKKMTAEEVELRKKRFEDTKHQAGWVAKDLTGNIIGSSIGFIDESGNQNIGALYIKKEWQGKGVANLLMREVVDWFDKSTPIQLTVATYNERAKAFYRRWGFEEIPGTEDMIGEKIPIITMKRKVDE